MAKFEPEESIQPGHHFSLQTLLLCVLGWGLLLSYSNTTGKQGPLQASIFVLFGVGAGVIGGALAGRFSERLYWATLISTLAFLAVAGGSLNDAGVFYSWGCVGASWGAMFPNLKPRQLLMRSMLYAAMGVLGMSVCIYVINKRIGSDQFFDMGAAAFIGALMGPLSTAAAIFDEQNNKLKLVLVGCLVASVLVGNWLVPILGGVNR